MRVRVEICFCGNNKYQVRLTTIATGKRTLLNVSDTHWDRRLASKCKDDLVLDQGLVRKNIRFV